MRNFRPTDFRGWYRKMDPELLEIMDKFVDLWGKKVWISPAEGAIGRRMNNTSGHNISHWGMVKAIDLMMEDLEDGDDFKRAYECGRDAGALGVGVYPDWKTSGKPTPGVHLDTKPREGRKAGNPGRWSAFRVNNRQQYFGIEKAFEV